MLKKPGETANAEFAEYAVFRSGRRPKAEALGYSEAKTPIRSGVGTVAFFVFLAGTAEAGVVAADLLAGGALHGCGGCRRTAGHASGFELTLLLALKFTFEGIDSG